MNINLENLVVGSEDVSDSKLCLFYIFKCIAIQTATFFLVPVKSNPTYLISASSVRT
jgi:hypothetical protein